MVSLGNIDCCRLGEHDLPALLAFCRENEGFYSYIRKTPDLASLRQALTVLPPNAVPEQKHFLGLWKTGELAAILDLIVDWPREGVAYIGWFMVAKARERAGLGRLLIGELCEQLKDSGYHTVRLGCVKDNLTGLGFWQACGFAPTGAAVDNILLFERYL